MSLRSRLVMVVALAMTGPLVAAWVAVGVVVPRARAAATAERLDRAAAMAAAVLHERCADVGEVARSLAADLGRPGQAPDVVAATLARRPGLSAAVVGPNVGGADPRGVLVAGPEATTLAALDPAVLTGARCTDAAGSSTAASEPPAAGTSTSTGAPTDAGTPTTDGSPGRPPVLRNGSAVLVASAPVLARDGTVVAVAVVTEFWGSPQLSDLVRRYHLATDLSVLSDDGTVLATTMSTGPTASSSSTTGSAGGRGLSSAPVAVAGGHYRVVALTRADDTGWQTRLLVLTSAAWLLLMAAVLVLARRITAPLVRLTANVGPPGQIDPDEVVTLTAAFDTMSDRLGATVAQLQDHRDVLAQTFEQFGEALGSTHDLDALLRIVVESARRGGRAAVGVALLGEDGDHLEERVACLPDGPSALRAAPRVLDDLAVLAARSVRDGRSLVTELSTAGPALAVPLRRGGALVGALALGRYAGEPPFEPDAEQAVVALATHAGTAVANVREHLEAQRLSVTDSMTGVANHRQLLLTLAREVERAHRFARPLSVLMLDLDHFKQVNDSHGHAFGDLVLREFAGRLQSCLREVDLVARYGGEEFALVLPETGIEGAEAVAVRIGRAVRQRPFTGLGFEHQVTVSVGIAGYPHHGLLAADLLRAADDALYQAKRDGRDGYAVVGVRPRVT